MHVENQVEVNVNIGDFENSLEPTPINPDITLDALMIEMKIQRVMILNLQGTLNKALRELKDRR